MTHMTQHTAAAGDPASDVTAACLVRADYELILSLVAVQATLCGQHETLTENHRITLEGGVSFDLELTFKSRALSRMLQQEPTLETSEFVRRTHKEVCCAWMHPGDGGPLLRYYREEAEAARIEAARAEAVAASAEGRPPQPQKSTSLRCAHSRQTLQDRHVKGGTALDRSGTSLGLTRG